MDRWDFAIYAMLLLSVRVTNGEVQSDLSVLRPVKPLFDSAKVSANFNVSLVCLLEHCLKSSIECGFSLTCDKTIPCVGKCFEDWNEDKTLEKFHVQNCTNKCSYDAFGNKPYYELMTCMTDHNCITFPPIPNTCKAPNVHPLKNLTVQAIEGEWWVVKGYHPLYDCYPCQHLKFTQINATFWNYQTTYLAYASDGTVQVTQEAQMPNSAPGINISFTYHDVCGSFHHETWWLIDSAEDGSYVQVYYCGNVLQWYYEGAIVLARNKTLSAADYITIANSYKKAVGLKLTDFCNTSTSPCPDWYRLTSNAAIAQLVSVASLANACMTGAN